MTTLWQIDVCTVLQHPLLFLPILLINCISLLKFSLWFGNCWCGALKLDCNYSSGFSSALIDRSEFIYDNELYAAGFSFKCQRNFSSKDSEFLWQHRRPLCLSRSLFTSFTSLDFTVITITCEWVDCCSLFTLGWFKNLFLKKKADLKNNNNSNNNFILLKCIKVV